MLVMCSHYGDSISSKKLNGHQAFELMSSLEHVLFREPPNFVFQLYYYLPKFLKALPLMFLTRAS